MTTRQITPPAALAVSLAAAQLAARVDVESGVSALDTDLTQSIKAFTDVAEHITGRAFVTQTLEMTLDCFPAVVTLSRSPLISVTSVKYYDANGVLQTMATADYIVDSKSVPARIVPAVGKAWPTTQARPSAVEIVFVAGYGADDTTVPPEAKEYILARIAKKHGQPGKGDVEDFECLLDQLRVYA